MVWRFQATPNGAQQQKFGAHSCIQVSSAPACLSLLRCGRERPAPRQSAAARARPLPSLSSIRLPLSCAHATITAGTICAATVASPAGLRARGAPIGAGIARAVAAAGGTATNAGITTEVAPSSPVSVFGCIARSAESISSAHRAIRRGRDRKTARPFADPQPRLFCAQGKRRGGDPRGPSALDNAPAQATDQGIGAKPVTCARNPRLLAHRSRIVTAERARRRVRGWCQHGPGDGEPR